MAERTESMSINISIPTWNCTFGKVTEMNGDWFDLYDSTIPDDVAQILWEPPNS